MPHFSKGDNSIGCFKKLRHSDWWRLLESEPCFWHIIWPVLRLYLWLELQYLDRLPTTVALSRRRQYLTMTHASPKWISISAFKSKTDPTKRTECFSKTILPNRARPLTPTSGMTSSKNLPRRRRPPRWDTGATQDTSRTYPPGIRRQTFQACSDAQKVRMQGLFEILKKFFRLFLYNAKRRSCALDNQNFFVFLVI